MKVPELHSGQEALSMRGFEEILVDKLLVEQLLEHLTDKERETIWLWATNHTLNEIALYLTILYEDRPNERPLSPSAVGARIKKIIEKLKTLAKEQ